MSSLKTKIAALTAFVYIGLAGAENTTDSVTVDINAQPIEAALLEFSRQTGLQVVIPAGALAASNAPRVSGSMSVEAALKLLLKDTDLTYKLIGNRTVSIIAPNKRANTAGGATDVRLARADHRPAFEGEDTSEDQKQAAEESEGFSANFSSKGIPEILVKGSRSKSLNADIVRTEGDIQPYIVFDKEEIARSGASSVDELLRTRLTMNYVARPAEAQDGLLAPYGTGSTSSIALRGLSADQTLILIDGRRAGPRSAFGQALQADLNTIALNAIERIEVLPATASGIYGGSATGGVVNIVMRRDYSGMEAAVRYENSVRGGGAQRRMDLNGGFTLNAGKTSILFNATMTGKSDLLAEDTAFFQGYVRRRDANLRKYDPLYFKGIYFPPLGATTNIVSAGVFDFDCYSQATAAGAADATARANCTATPLLTLKPAYGGGALDSAITHVPGGYAGAATDAGLGLRQNAGAYNLDLANTDQTGARRASLLNGPTIGSVSATFKHQLTSSIEAFLTASASRNDARFRQNASGNTAMFTIDSAVANNPFEQTIQVTVPFRIGSGNETRVRNEALQALGGVNIKLSSDWAATLEYSIDRTDLQQSSASSSIAFEANTQIGTLALNVLTDPAGEFDLGEYVVPGQKLSPTHSIQQRAAVRVAGPAVSLPAGSVVLTAMLEHQGQSFSEQTIFQSFAPGVVFPYTFTEQRSAVQSAYVEAQVPLISESMQFAALRLADLQLAGRYDRYRNRGGFILGSPLDLEMPPESSFSSIDPTVGIRIQPLSWMTLRASYGTGFLPPALSLLYSIPAQQAGNYMNLRDPRRGGELLNTYFEGGLNNAFLKPEQSSSKSFGLILNPSEGLRLSLDWTRTTKHDNISSLTATQENINLESLLPDFIVRDSDPATFGSFGVGPITGLRTGLTNVTRSYFDSYDFSLKYSIVSQRFGRFELSSSATRLVHSSQQLLPFTPAIESAGTVSAPSWQANAAATWIWWSCSATWATRYLDRVWLMDTRAFDPGHGSNFLPSEVYHDLAFEYRFDNATYAFLAGSQVQLGVKNIFDTKPRFMGSSFPMLYDGYTSPMQATYYLSFSARR